MCQTDRDRIACCLDGHPEAFRELVGRYQGVLLSHLAGRMGDRDRAEEAVQETFVRAYFSLSKLKKPESFFSWLIGIANRVALEQHRSDRRQREIAQMMSEPEARPELSHDYALERAITQLPERYQRVVLLRYYGQRSCAHVAEELGIPLGTVTKRLSRAYGMLREALTRQEQEQERTEAQP